MDAIHTNAEEVGSGYQANILKADFFALARETKQKGQKLSAGIRFDCLIPVFLFSTEIQNLV